MNKYKNKPERHPNLIKVLVLLINLYKSLIFKENQEMPHPSFNAIKNENLLI